MLRPLSSSTTALALCNARAYGFVDTFCKDSLTNSMLMASTTLIARVSTSCHLVTYLPTTASNSVWNITFG